MSRVAVVTDTTGYLPGELVRAHGIHLVSLYVNFGGEKTVREADITNYDRFYEELRESLTPSHPLQLHVFSQISSILWRLQRANETEKQLYARRQRNTDPPCLTLAKAFNTNPTGNPFLLYSRYERHLRNTYLRLIRELKKIQKEDQFPSSIKK